MKKPGCQFASRIALLAAVSLGVPAGADPVIDDEKLEKQFVHGVLQLPEMGRLLTGRQVGQALPQAEGRKAKRSAGPARAAPTHAEAVASTVVIGTVEKCQDCDDWHLGVVSTGWLVGAEGLVATNYHVLEDDSENRVGVMTSDGRVFPLREVVAADRDGDAVLVRLGGDVGGLPWLPLAERARTGEGVRVVGHPDGRFYSLTGGMVSRVFVGPQEEGAERRAWLTVTADYGAGSSGGPVLNADGEVIGMVSSTATLLADPEEGESPRPEDVQMVFRDCVSLDTLRGMLED
jgi:serine protease Do